MRPEVYHAFPHVCSLIKSGTRCSHKNSRKSFKEPQAAYDNAETKGRERRDTAQQQGQECLKGTLCSHPFCCRFPPQARGSLPAAPHAALPTPSTARRLTPPASRLPPRRRRGRSAPLPSPAPQPRHAAAHLQLGFRRPLGVDKQIVQNVLLPVLLFVDSHHPLRPRSPFPAGGGHTGPDPPTTAATTVPGGGQTSSAGGSALNPFSAAQRGDGQLPPLRERLRGTEVALAAVGQLHDKGRGSEAEEPSSLQGLC